MPLESLLFPEEEATELVTIVGDNRDLADLLNPVDNTISTVRGMLGDYGAVASAIEVWRVQAAGRVASSRTFVEDARPSLDGNWGGPAYRAFDTYTAQTEGRLEEAQEKMNEVAEALDDMSEVVKDQYLAAIDTLGSAARMLVSIATGGIGGRRRIPSELIGTAQEVLDEFIRAVARHVGQVVSSFHDYRDVVGRVRGAVAQLRVPAPADVAAPEIGDPELWEPA